MELAIRNARPDDLDAIESIEQSCFSDPWTGEMLLASLPDERHEFIVAEKDGELLGYCAMIFVLDEGDISNVAVRPEARRNGVGRALIGEMLRRAAEMGLAFVTLEVRAHNDAAIGLYSAEGFRQVGIRRGYYLRPREDAVLMTKYLCGDTE